MTRYFLLEGDIVLRQSVLNQLLQDIVDANDYRDWALLKRKIQKAKSMIDPTKQGRKPSDPNKIICKQCNREMMPYSKDLCRTCGSKNRMGRPRI